MCKNNSVKKIVGGLPPTGGCTGMADYLLQLGGCTGMADYLPQGAVREWGITSHRAL